MNKVILPSEALAIAPANLALISYSSNIDPETGALRPSALSQFIGDVGIAGWGKTQTRFVSASEISFGETQRSTGDLVFDDYSERGIPRSRLKAINTLSRDPDLHLDNTGLQVEALAENFNNDSDELIGLAMSYHIVRILRNSDAFGLRMNLIAADNLWRMPAIKSKFDPDTLAKHAKVIDALPDFAKREKLTRAISLFDRKGRLLNVGTKIQSPRIHDLDAEHGGAFLSTAKKVQRKSLLKVAA